MKRFLLIICCLAILPLLHAQTWQQQSGKLSFEINNAGIAVDGHFEDEPAISLGYTNHSIKDMKLSGSVAVAGIKTGIGIRDKHLLRSDYFDVEHYPTITLVSQSFNVSNSNLTGRFLLTMKGISKPVEIVIHMQETASTLTMVGEFNINRKDFNVGSESLTLSNEVSIKVEAVFVKV